MTEFGEFLRSCRARVSSEQLGLAERPRSRRVPGLRREELAERAGVSVDYVVRLEQGRATSPSPEVLDALAHALELRPDEHEYLIRCAATAAGRPTGTARRSPSSTRQVRPQTRRLLDGMPGVPALVLGRRMDIVAWNPLGRALIVDFETLPVEHRNLTWLTFLDPGVRRLYRDWEKAARDCVAYLRMDAGKYPNDPLLAALVGELSVKDPDFRHWWSDHRVRAQQVGRKRFDHPTAGPMTLDFQTLLLQGSPEQTLLVYTAEPGSRSAEALRFLAGWAEPARLDRVTDGPNG